jgi:hypothetical protein
MMKKILTLPADTHEVQIKKIPELLSKATFPLKSDSPKVIDCLYRNDVPHNASAVEKKKCSGNILTDEDWNILNQIWADSGLPPYTIMMCESEWLPYSNAIEAKNLDWSVVPWFATFEILLYNLEVNHKKQLVDAIAKGKVVAVNQATRLPLTPSMNSRAFNEAVMRIDEFISYANKFDICVQVGGAKVRQEEMADENTKKKQQRQDALAVELDEILSGIEKHNPAFVMAELKKRIGQPDSCVIANTGDGIKWERNGGQTEMLNIQALAERIRYLKMKKHRLS